MYDCLGEDFANVSGANGLNNVKSVLGSSVTLCSWDTTASVLVRKVPLVAREHQYPPGGEVCSPRLDRYPHLTSKVTCSMVPTKDMPVEEMRTMPVRPWPSWSEALPEFPLQERGKGRWKG